MYLKYNAVKNLRSSRGNTIECDVSSGELTCNYNFEVCYFATEFNCDIDNVIELMKSDDKFRSIYFNYQGKFTIVGGVFYFGDRFSVNRTLENKGMCVEFLQFLKPYICIKNEDKIAELLKLDSSMFPIYQTRLLMIKEIQKEVYLILEID